MSVSRVRIGIIGCGDICRKAYLPGCQRYENLEIVAFADLREEAAQEMAKAHGRAKAFSVDALLADPAVELVLNLTIPSAHGPVNLRALEHGKHVYCEKPFCLTRAEGQAVLELAARKKLLVGCAPDTFLGDSHQTCRKLVDDGLIGEPKSGVAFMLCPGHEGWHPCPAFYYAPGGGPLFDMGPYYLTALVNLLGPVRRVSAMASTAKAERVIGSAPLKGQVMKVETPTHLSGLLEFVSGAIITTIFSFDNQGHHLPHIEVYGTEGSLYVPDPNRFSDPVSYRTRATVRGEVLSPPQPHNHGGTRGLGVADLAAGVRSLAQGHGRNGLDGRDGQVADGSRRPARAHRASGVLAYHVFDVMQAYFDSAESGCAVTVASTCTRPTPLPLDLPPNRVD